MTKINPDRKIIVLTGGPGGGKTTLIEELFNEPKYKDKFIPLPEAVFYVLKTRTSPKEKQFQRMMFEVQTAMEDAIDKSVETDKIILCHRGSLDPLGYWLNNGWDANDFFQFTQTTLKEHLERYFAVIHLQSAAVNAAQKYRVYPDTHRHETPEQAEQLDSLLARVWEGHPNYYIIESQTDWEIKRSLFYEIIGNI